MKLFYTIPAFLFLICSCNNKPASNGKPSLDHEKFVDVLTDVQLLEGAYSSKFQRVDSLRKDMAEFYAQVYGKHKISRSQFEETFNWYTAHPDELATVYSEVFDKLSKMEVEVRQEQTDSLTKAKK